MARSLFRNHLDESVDPDGRLSERSDLAQSVHRENVELSGEIVKRLALVFALALLVAACGDVDLSRTTTAPPTTVPAAAAVDAAEGGGDDEHAEASAHEEDEADHSAADMGDDAMSEEVTPHDEDDGHDAPTSAGVDRTVEVAMDEFTFAPVEFEAMAGETVEFVVSNLGVVEHEFRLSNEHRIEEHLAEGHADHADDNDGGHHADGDVVLHLDPGETGSLIVTFGDDTTLYTEVACLIPGHYEAGMKAPMRLGA